MEENLSLMFEQTIKGGNDYIFIKLLCDLFGINYDNQCRIVARHKIMRQWSIKMPGESVFGDNYPRIALTREGFVMWVFQINPQLINPELREKLEAYQQYIVQALFIAPKAQSEASIKYAELEKAKFERKELDVKINSLTKDLQDYMDDILRKQLKLDFRATPDKQQPLTLIEK